MLSSAQVGESRASRRGGTSGRLGMLSTSITFGDKVSTNKQDFCKI